MRGRPCLVSSCRINHLGMKPVRGGSPPSESSRRAARAARLGVLAQARAKVLILVEEVDFRVRNAAEVIAMYVPRARRVRCGANWRTMIIHPR